MHADSRAFVVHRTKTRIRIKIPERQRQEAYFAAMQRALLQHSDVLRVHVNALTASVVIECKDGFAFLTKNHRFPGLELLPIEILPAVGACRAGTGHSWPAGETGVAMILIKLLVALATRQPGTLLIGWIFAAVARTVSDEARRTAEAQRLLPASTLLVALAE